MTVTIIQRNVITLMNVAPTKTNIASIRFAVILTVLVLTCLAATSRVTLAQGVSAPLTVNNSPGNSTLTYSASFNPTAPAVNSEDELEDETWSWSGNCTPASGSSSVSVSYTAAQPGSYTSTVSCTCTWQEINIKTGGNDGSTSVNGSANTLCNFGVLWTPGKITGGVLTKPQNQTSTPSSPSAVIEPLSATAQCAVSSATATDTASYGGNTTYETATDTVTYAWTAKQGTIASPSAQTTSWTLPSTSGTYMATCKVSATPGAIGPYDGGSRGPSAISATATVYLVQLTVTGGSWSPNPAYVNQPLTGQASGQVSPSVPGEVDNVDWETSQVYYSSTGTSGSFTPFAGSEALVWTQGSLTTQFTGGFWTVGFYIISMTGTDTIKDANGNTLGTVSGTGYIGGDASDISGGSGPDARKENVETAMTGGASTGVPVVAPRLGIALWPGGKHVCIYVPAADPQHIGYWFGFYPNQPSGSGSSGSSGSSGNGPGVVVVDDDPPSGASTFYTAITLAQATTLLSAVTASENNHPAYNLLSYNCATWASSMLQTVYSDIDTDSITPSAVYNWVSTNERPYPGT